MKITFITCENFSLESFRAALPATVRIAPTFGAASLINFLRPQLDRSRKSVFVGHAGLEGSSLNAEMIALSKNKGRGTALVQGPQQNHTLSHQSKTPMA